MLPEVRIDLTGSGTEIAGFAEATRAPSVLREDEAAGRTVSRAEPRPSPRSARGDSTEARAPEFVVPESEPASAEASPAPQNMPALSPAANVPETNHARNEDIVSTLL